MAIERVPLALFNKMREPGSLVYLFRLAAFLVILYAIYKQTFVRRAKARHLHVVSATE